MSMQSILGQLDDKIALLPFWGIIGIYVVVLLLMVLISSWKKWLTPSGSAGAFTLGFMVLYLGGFSAFFLFLFFFVSCSALSKIRRSCNPREKKSSRRDLMQVIANGLPAVLALFLTRSFSLRMIALTAFSASIAEATADTWASTFGIMSRRTPVSIITMTPVPRGISGGVTLLGLSAAALGAALTALLHVFVFRCGLAGALVVAGTGFLGCVIDSVLGATVQEQFRRNDGSLTEKETEGEVKNERVRGIAGFDNDMVNLTSGLLTLSLSLLMATLVL